MMTANTSDDYNAQYNKGGILRNYILSILVAYHIVFIPSARAFTLFGAAARSKADVNLFRSSSTSYGSLRDLLDFSASSEDKNGGGSKEDESTVDNFNNMLNSSSKFNRKKSPEGQVLNVKSQKDETQGQHLDRLSTFTFANENQKKKLADMMLPNEDSEAINYSKNINFATDKTQTSSDLCNDTTDELIPDNFNNRGIAISKSKYPFKSTISINNGDTDDHADALSTFSFASKNEKNNSTSSAVSIVSERDSIDDYSDYDDRLKTFSLSKASYHFTLKSDTPFDVNHIDRLSTFSFASNDPRSGSTSTASKNSFKTDDESITEKNLLSPDKNSMSSRQLKISLSSIASSVSTVSRNDRIQEVRLKNDPKILHPDGMNVPRLNNRGSVMSMSGAAGRPNIFQRIDQEKVNFYEEYYDDKDSLKDKDEDPTYDSNIDDERGDDSTIKGFIVESTTEHSNEQHGSGDCFIGLDFGTSGARMSIVEKYLKEDMDWDYNEVFVATLAWDDSMHYDSPYDWRAAVDALLSRAKKDTDVMSKVKALCVSGTSASCFLLHPGTLEVSRKTRMYNYDIALSSSACGYDHNNESIEPKIDESCIDRVLKLIETYVPKKHIARATTGSLAKLLMWNEEEPMVDASGTVKEVLCHQSDYISLYLMNEGLDKEDHFPVSSDWHNVLKLGYDVRSLSYPPWLFTLLEEGAKIPYPEDILPFKVISPGERLGVISPHIATKFGLPNDTVLVGGTTDSNSAFFAAVGIKPEFGQAVTSLGSTLALKLLSKTYVEDASHGVYSHRFPRFGLHDDNLEEAWLVGGASNVGCAVLRQEGFSDEELSELSAEIDPNFDSSFSYYPLTKKGERFPISDSEKLPVLNPKPNDRKEYLHGILQGISDVEREGYRILGELGSTPKRPTVILSCGGGSKNNVWTAIRERRLDEICDEGQHILVQKAFNTEASYGAALLAAASFE